MIPKSTLAEAQAALDLNIGGIMYKTEVGRKVLDGYMPNIDPEIHDKIIAEFEQEEEQNAEEDAFGDGNVNESNENRQDD